MKSTLTLQPVTRHDAVLQFSWDEKTGQLTGHDAALVMNLCQQAIRDGYIQGHPYPTCYAIVDPLHRRREMAVVLGQFWRLEGDLLKAYPRVGRRRGADRSELPELN